MNKKQKRILWVGITVFCLTLLFAPWQVTPAPYLQTDLISGNRYSIPRTAYSMNSPIWDAPNGGELMTGTLLFEWAGIGVISALVMLASRDSNKNPAPSRNQP